MWRKCAEGDLNLLKKVKNLKKTKKTKKKTKKTLTPKINMLTFVRYPAAHNSSCSYPVLLRVVCNILLDTPYHTVLKRFSNE